MVYFGVALFLILFVMALYLRSVLITIFTFIDVVFSFVFAYFLYIVVFRIPHIPMLAILTLLLLIAIAADDVFVFYDTFEMMKLQHPDSDLEDLISKTMQDAAISILVTSLTTAAALFANIVSQITDIKCFGIIAGTALVMNYFLVITWIPCGIILIEKFDKKYLSNTKCCTCFTRLTGLLKNVSESIFHRCLPTLISKAWFVWLILFLGLGLCGLVITYITPKMKYPESKDFALFKKDSIIETWFLDVKYKFRYSYISRHSAGGIEMSAIFGIKSRDTGNHMDPDSIGDLEFESLFDLSLPDAQKWMLNFCNKIKSESIVNREIMGRKKCTLDIFYSFVSKSCPVFKEELQFMIHKAAYNMSDLNAFDGCCGHTLTPIPSNTFKNCFFSLSPIITMTYSKASLLDTAYFDIQNHELKTYSVNFTIKDNWSVNFVYMDTLYRRLQDWMDNQLESAPPSLKHGWLAFYDAFELYDLQRALASGTHLGIGVSMASAFIVMFLTSRNIVITMFAIFTIFQSICVTSGALVLLGWELNVIESVTMTLAVGLSFDFCIHYGMAYRLSEKDTRAARVREAFERVGAANFMAAETTVITGICMLPATVMFYWQLGSFLRLVMVVSWSFATLFFQSLCHILGPTGTFGQFPSPLTLLSFKENKEEKNSQQLTTKIHKPSMYHTFKQVED